jgi:hypothetical protein
MNAVMKEGKTWLWLTIAITTGILWLAGEYRVSVKYSVVAVLFASFTHAKAVKGYNDIAGFLRINVGAMQAGTSSRKPPPG